MKTLTIWFINEATMCCWLIKTTFKLIFGLIMPKNTCLYFCYFYYSLHWFSDASSSFSSSSISSSYSISSSSSPSISRKLYILLTMFHCQKWFCCNYNCLHPTTLIKIELFYIYFSKILVTGAEQVFCWTSPNSYLPKS